MTHWTVLYKDLPIKPEDLHILPRQIDARGRIGIFLLVSPSPSPSPGTLCRFLPLVPLSCNPFAFSQSSSLLLDFPPHVRDQDGFPRAVDPPTGPELADQLRRRSIFLVDGGFVGEIMICAEGEVDARVGAVSIFFLFFFFLLLLLPAVVTVPCRAGQGLHDGRPPPLDLDHRPPEPGHRLRLPHVAHAHAEVAHVVDDACGHADRVPVAPHGFARAHEVLKEGAVGGEGDGAHDHGCQGGEGGVGVCGSGSGS